MIYKVHYEPKENLNIESLLDISEYHNLCCDIDSTNLSDSQKSFLKLAATRFIRFNYAKIADYYSTVNSTEMKDLIERLHLVVVDYNNAIEKGYIEYFEGLEKIVGDIVGE